MFATARGTTTSDSATVLVTCGATPHAALAVVNASAAAATVVLGAPAVLDASGTVDADTAAPLLSYSWSLATAPMVRRAATPPPGTPATVFHAASLQPLAPSLLSATSLVPARTTWAAAAAATAGGAPGAAPFPYAALVADGLGTFSVSVTVSDGCSSEAASASFTVVCASPGPRADAGGDMTLTRSVQVPVGSTSEQASLRLGPAALGALFGPVTLTAAPGAAAYAWVLLSAPPLSAYNASSGVLPAVVLNAATGALPSPLPASVLSLRSNLSFVPDALGTFVVLLAASDGCSIAYDTIAVTALIDAVNVRGQRRGCLRRLSFYTSHSASPPCSPWPSLCSARAPPRRPSPRPAPPSPAPRRRRRSPSRCASPASLLRP